MFIARYTGIHANIKYELLDEISRDPFIWVKSQKN